MAFCSRCGAQIGDGERFCGKCGADRTAKAGGAPDAIPQPVGAPRFAAPAHMPYVAPGQVSMSVAMPPQAPARKSGMMWLGIIIVAAGGYYYYTHYMHPQGQTPGNPPQSQPAPQGQPGGQGPGATNAQVVHMQSFTAQITVDSGDVEILNGQWTNNSTVAIQSATLECIQYSINGEQLTQDEITISDPNNKAVPPQHTITFDPFAGGTLVPGATRASCGIVAVVPAG